MYKVKIYTQVKFIHVRVSYSFIIIVLKTFLLKVMHMDFYVKLNNRHLTLKLLSTMKILSILEKNIKCISVRDAIDTLEVPYLIASDIANEHDYEMHLYFQIVIEPNIAYTYQNQYEISFMFVKYIIHRFTSFI